MPTQYPKTAPKATATVIIKRASSASAFAIRLGPPKPIGIVEKGLVNSIKVDGRTQRVIFFDPTRLEKRLREFVVNYKPNTVTEVTGVTDSKPSLQDSPLFNSGAKSDALPKKTVTSVTSVTDNQPDEFMANFELPGDEPE